MLARLGIRFGSALVGIALGIVVSAAALSGVSVTPTALLEATAVFWIVHIVVSFVALRILVRQPSVSMAGLLAVASTVVSLIVVSLIISGLSIRGPLSYLGATLIIWATTALGDVVGDRMIRARRHRDRRD